MSEQNSESREFASTDFADDPTVEQYYARIRTTQDIRDQNGDLVWAEGHEIEAALVRAYRDNLKIATLEEAPGGGLLETEFEVLERLTP